MRKLKARARRALVASLDVVVVAGISGVLLVCYWALENLGYAFHGRTSVRYLLTGFKFDVFLSIVALWVGLTGVMGAHAVKSLRSDVRSAVWARMLLTHLMVVGPTAYYLGYFRPEALALGAHKAAPALLEARRSRSLLDALCFAAYWGAISLIVTVGIVLIAPISQAMFSLLGTILLLLIGATGASSIVLWVLLLLDAGDRPDEAWAEVDYLRLLSPWAWVFGMRRYYRQILRPELINIRG